MGPVLPYENVRHVNGSYGGGLCVQSAVLPPQSNSSFRIALGKNQEEASLVKQQYTPVKSINSSNVDLDSKGQPQQYSLTKANSGMSAERNSNPYYQLQSKEGVLDSQLSIDAKLLQAQSRFVAAGAAVVAVAAHREVGAMQFGLT